MQPIDDSSILVDESIFSFDSFSNDKQTEKHYNESITTIEKTNTSSIGVSPRKIRHLTSKQRRVRLANVNSLSIDQIKMLELG